MQILFDTVTRISTSARHPQGWPTRGNSPFRVATRQSGALLGSSECQPGGFVRLDRAFCAAILKSSTHRCAGGGLSASRRPKCSLRANRPRRPRECRYTLNPPRGIAEQESGEHSPHWTCMHANAQLSQANQSRKNFELLHASACADGDCDEVTRRKFSARMSRSSAAALARRAQPQPRQASIVACWSRDSAWRFAMLQWWPLLPGVAPQERGSFFKKVR